MLRSEPGADGGIVQRELLAAAHARMRAWDRAFIGNWVFQEKDLVTVSGVTVTVKPVTTANEMLSLLGHEHSLTTQEESSLPHRDDRGDALLRYIGRIVENRVQSMNQVFCPPAVPLSSRSIATSRRLLLTKPLAVASHRAILDPEIHFPSSCSVRPSAISPFASRIQPSTFIA